MAAHPGLYRAPSLQVMQSASTPKCIDAVVTYIKGKKPGVTTPNYYSVDNMVKVLRDDILKKKGFPNISATSVDNLLKLLNYTKYNPSTSTGTGKKKINSGPGDYTYKDVLRYQIFNVLKSWTSISLLGIYKPTESFRDKLAYANTQLAKNTETLEHHHGRNFVYDFSKWGSATGTISICNSDEIDSIIRIAIEKGSNLAKDKKLRDFLLNKISNAADKTTMVNIELKINPLPIKISGKNVKSPEIPRTPADITFVKNLFYNMTVSPPSNTQFTIRKRQCGKCWLCGTAIYFYRLELTSTPGTYVDLCACGELEHIIPPGIATILGLLSSTHDEVVTRLKNPEDKIANYGLAASHGLCNVIKSDLIYLVADKISGYNRDDKRINAFCDQMKYILADTSNIQSKNYETQFDSSKLTTLEIDTFINKMNTEIKKTLDKIIVEMNIIKIGNVTQSASYKSNTQLELRTMLFGVKTWFDMIKDDPNFETFSKKWKNAGGSKYKKMKGGNFELNNRINTCIDAFIENYDNKEECVNIDMIDTEIEENINNAYSIILFNIRKYSTRDELKSYILSIYDFIDSNGDELFTIIHSLTGPAQIEREKIEYIRSIIDYHTALQIPHTTVADDEKMNSPNSTEQYQPQSKNNAIMLQQKFNQQQHQQQEHAWQQQQALQQQQWQQEQQQALQQQQWQQQQQQWQQQQEQQPEQQPQQPELFSFGIANKVVEPNHKPSKHQSVKITSQQKSRNRNSQKRENNREAKLSKNRAKHQAEQRKKRIDAARPNANMSTGGRYPKKNKTKKNKKTNKTKKTKKTQKIRC
jgi:hypothetical protein